MSEESNAHLIEQLEKLGAAVRPWTPDDFICFAIVAREGLPTILASLRRSAPASGEMRTALTELVEAVKVEVNEKGAGGYLLARLSDAQAALRTPSGETREEVGP